MPLAHTTTKGVDKPPKLPFQPDTYLHPNKESAHWEQAAKELVICAPSPLLQQCMHAKLLQSCPTLCNPMDNSPLGSSIHGILQARILEWVAISSWSRSSCLPVCVVFDFFHPCPIVFKVQVFCFLK